MKLTFATGPRQREWFEHVVSRLMEIINVHSICKQYTEDGTAVSHPKKGILTRGSQSRLGPVGYTKGRT